MLEPRAHNFLMTFKDDACKTVDPLDFTVLLNLRDRGYVEITLTAGKIVARRTSKGKIAVVSKR